MVQARVIFLFSKFGIVIVTFITKTDLFSSTTKPTLIALRKKTNRTMCHQRVKSADSVQTAQLF